MTARKKDVSDVDAISCFAWISWNGPDSAWTFAVVPPWTFEVAPPRVGVCVDPARHGRRNLSTGRGANAERAEIRLNRESDLARRGQVGPRIRRAVQAEN